MFASLISTVLHFHEITLLTCEHCYVFFETSAASGPSPNPGPAPYTIASSTRCYSADENRGSGKTHRLRKRSTVKHQVQPEFRILRRRGVFVRKVRHERTPSSHRSSKKHQMLVYPRRKPAKHVTINRICRAQVMTSVSGRSRPLSLCLTADDFACFKQGAHPIEASIMPRLLRQPDKRRRSRLCREARNVKADAQWRLRC